MNSCRGILTLAFTNSIRKIYGIYCNNDWWKLLFLGLFLLKAPLKLKGVRIAAVFIDSGGIWYHNCLVVSDLVTKTHRYHQLWENTEENLLLHSPVKKDATTDVFICKIDHYAPFILIFNKPLCNFDIT